MFLCSCCCLFPGTFCFGFPPECSSCLSSSLVRTDLSQLPPSIPHSITHSLTPSLTHSLTYSLTPSIPLSLTPCVPFSLTPSFPPSLTQSLTHSLPHSSLTPSLTPSLPYSLTPHSLTAHMQAQCNLPKYLSVNDMIDDQYHIQKCTC